MPNFVNKIYFVLIVAITVISIGLFATKHKVLATSDLASGLVGYWNMDSSDIDWSANTIVDRSGNGNKGTLVGLNSASLQTGKIGEAVDFNSSGTYINVPYSQSLNSSITNALTYAAWIKIDEAPTDWVSIFDKGNNQSFAIYKNGLILFRPGGTVSQLVAYLPSTAASNSVGQWFHIAATYNGQTNVIYLNGVSPCSTCSATSSGTVGGNSTVRIGGGNLPFKGVIDEARIYNRALSAQEIMDLYQVTSFQTVAIVAPSAPQGVISPSHTTNTINLSWTANSETDILNYKVYQNGNPVAVLGADVITYIASNLTAATNYQFKITATNKSNMESPQSAPVDVTTSPVEVVVTGTVTPGQYLAALNHPIFKSGNTLPPLTRWGWPLSYDTKVETSRWGYALDLGDADDPTVAKLSDPNSDVSKLIALANGNPSQYKVFINIPRVPIGQIPSSVYAHDASGNQTTTWSPEAPDSALSQMATYISNNLQKVTSKVPVAVILNGGERYLGVCGFDCAKWQLDASIVAAKGSLSWADYTAQRKTHQEMFFTNAVHALTSAIYVYYPIGSQYRVDANRTGFVWDWDYRWMNTVANYPGASMYWGQFNSGWTGHQKNTDMLSQVLNAYGYDVTFGKPLSYNWVNAGWGTESGGWADIERYYGFLKSYYVAGMIGGIAGYFEYPTGGFNASFDATNPPHWLKQIEVLGRVHAEFSYLEDIIRNGDLLPGPYMNEVTHDQPAYEFRTGYPDTRVLVRKMRGQKRWLISAWAADNISRRINVDIPVIGTVSLQAQPSGSLYDARIVGGVLSLTQIDSGSMNPTVSLPGTQPDSDSGAPYVPPPIQTVPVATLPPPQVDPVNSNPTPTPTVAPNNISNLTPTPAYVANPTPYVANLATKTPTPAPVINRNVSTQPVTQNTRTNNNTYSPKLTYTKPTYTSELLSLQESTTSIDISVPRIPSWIEVIRSLLLEVFSRMKRGVERTVGMVKGVF